MDNKQLLRAEVQELIKAHETSDLNALLLQRDKYPGLPLPEIADQIKARKKAKYKLPSWYNTPDILYPKAVAIEQASSEITAQWKANYIGQGKSGVDLTGGFGVDSHFFAQNFKNWVHVEPNTELQEVVRHNFALLDHRNVSFSNLTSEAYLATQKSKVDFIYLDPDRRPSEQRVAGFKDSRPDVTRLLPQLASLSSQVLIKASPMIDITAALADLEDVKTVLVVSINNEVKEVLFHLDFKNNQEITFRCIDVNNRGEKRYNYFYNESNQEIIKITSIESYLYEPGAAIMKVQGQDILAGRHGLTKLHRNTNLYTANHAIADYPGRVFKVLANLPYKKKALADYLPDRKANISTRNFVDTPEQMKKKLGVKDGGELYLFGYRDFENKNRVAVCQRMYNIAV